MSRLVVNDSILFFRKPHFPPIDDTDDPHTFPEFELPAIHTPHTPRILNA